MAEEVNLPQKTSWTLPLIFILSLLSLAVSGYLFWQNQKLMKQLATVQYQSSMQAKLSISPESPNIPDQNANWKTYSGSFGPTF